MAKTPKTPLNSFQDTAIARLSEAGLRLTNPRKAIIAVLATANQPLSAYQIQKILVAENKKVDVVSIYRTLTTLDSLDLIHYIHAADGFIACTREHEDHHAGIEHAVCDECGSVLELGISPITTKQINAELLTHGFAPKGVKVEISGTCQDCQPKT